MSLLMPETGLLFWMLLSFGIVFFILAKYGFPVITKTVEERHRHIQDSLDAAREANEKVASITQECDNLIASARAEQVKILRDAAETRNRIVEEAKAQAREEGAKELREFKAQMLQEKQQTLREMRQQIAELSVEVAEKVLRKNLDSNQSQLDMIDRLVDEALVSKS